MVLFEWYFVFEYFNQNDIMLYFKRRVFRVFNPYMRSYVYLSENNLQKGLKNYAITCANTGVCSSVVHERIVLMNSWLYREQCNTCANAEDRVVHDVCSPAFPATRWTMQSAVLIPESVQVLQVNALHSSIHGYTENNTITCAYTEAREQCYHRCLYRVHVLYPSVLGIVPVYPAWQKHVKDSYGFDFQWWKPFY